MNDPDEATIAEAAEMFGVNRRTLYWAVYRGHLPVKRRQKRGGAALVIVDLADVEAWAISTRPYMRDGKLPTRVTFA